MTCFSFYKRNKKENVIPMYWHICEVKIYIISIQTLTDALLSLIKRSKTVNLAM